MYLGTVRRWLRLNPYYKVGGKNNNIIYLNNKTPKCKIYVSIYVPEKLIIKEYKLSSWLMAGPKFVKNRRTA